jgi:prefoldin beta subunit
MAEEQLPPQLRDQLNQYQRLQQQLQVIVQQRAQTEARTKELEKASGALTEAADDAPIYRMVGAFLIRTKGKSHVLKDITDDAETQGVRIKNLERQEARLKEQLNELQSKIQNALARLESREE